MSRLRLLVALGTLPALVFTACDESSENPLGVEPKPSGTLSSSHTAETQGTNSTDLIAAQSIDVGDITVTSDGSDLTVNFDTEGNWCLLESHVHAADTEAGIPQTSTGNPIPGRFDARTENLGCITSHSETVSQPDAGSDGHIAVAAHAVVTDPSADDVTETAWGDGERFVDRGNWATFITFDPSGGSGCPAISSVSNVEIVDPPSDVTQGSFTSASVRAFSEGTITDHGGFPLNIDTENNLFLDTNDDVSAGEPVCSYYVHFDDANASLLNLQREMGSLAFEGEIVGLIVAGGTNPSDIWKDNGINTLCETDADLGLSGTTYPGATASSCGINGDARGLEMFSTDPTASSNQDQTEISSDKTSVSFNIEISNKHDSFRILLDPGGGGVIVEP